MVIATHLACSRRLLQILKEQTHCSCQNVNFYCPYPTLFTLPMAVNSCCPCSPIPTSLLYIFYIVELVRIPVVKKPTSFINYNVTQSMAVHFVFLFYFSLLFHHILVYFAFLIQCKTIASYFPGLS